MAEVVLLFPPHCDPRGPYLALPSLTAFLGERGVEVTQRDLNIDAFETFLTRENIAKAGETITRELEGLDAERHARLSKAAKVAPYVAENIEGAKKVLRGEEFYEVDKYNWGRKVLALGAEVLSATCHPTQWSLLDYKMKYSPHVSAEVLAATADRRENLFLRFYEDAVVPRVLEEGPSVVGISVETYHQIIPGLTLARLLKGRGPHVTVGGALFTKLADRPEVLRDLFSAVDSFIVYEGEHALLGLLEGLRAGRGLGEVPNLIYREGDGVRANRLMAEDLDALPTPDFQGLPLHLYFAPRPVLPLSLSKGCYWRRCTFCEIHHSNTNSSRPYRTRAMEKVVDDIAVLKERHGTEHFLFTDECVAPNRLRALSERLLERKLEIKWACYSRFEKTLDKDLCRLIAGAGCRKLLLGLESGCDRVLGLMDKGIDKKLCRRILEDLKSEGIAVHIFCMLGFPTERKEEAMETLSFLLENKEAISTIGLSMDMGIFSLARHSEIYKEPERFGIANVCGGDDLAIRYDFETAGGMAREEVHQAQEEFYEVLDKVFSLRFLPYWEEYSLLYMDRYGKR